MVNSEGEKEHKKQLSILDMASDDRKEMAEDLQTTKPADEQKTPKTSREDLTREAALRLRNKTIAVWIDQMDGSPLVPVLEIIQKSPWIQLLMFLGGTTLLSLLLVASGGGVREASSLNFLPFLVYFLGAIYFSRFAPATSLAISATITGWSIILFGLGLSGFAPTLYFGVSLILVTIFASSGNHEFISIAAEQTTLSRQLQHELIRKEKQETHGSVNISQEAEMNGFKEREMTFRKQRLLFSELFIHLRTLSVSLNEKDLFDSIHFILGKGLKVQSLEIFFLDDTGNHLFAADAATMNNGKMESRKFDMRVRHDNENILSRCINAGKSFSAEDIKRDQMIQSLVAKSPCNTVYCAPLVAENEARGVLNVSASEKDTLDDMESKLFVATAAVAGAALNNAKTFLLTQEELENKEIISEREKKERIKTRNLLDRIMDRKIVEEVMKNPDKTFSDRIRITTLLADVRGFTTMSEKMNPRDVVELLNSFFSTLTPIIFKYGGTLDKYIGDEIMALFGPPQPKGNHAEMAILCALEMKSAFKQLQKRWLSERNITLEMGVALNTGDAIVGFIGSENLTNYTAIGDSVNTAARLEDVTPAGKIYMTEFTYNDVADFVEAKHISSVAFKGKEKVVNYYEVLSLNTKSPSRKLSTPSDLKIPLKTREKPHSSTRNKLAPDFVAASAAETKVAVERTDEVSRPTQRANTAARPIQRPHTGAQPPQRPHTGAQPPQRPHTGAQPPQRPHTGAQPPQRPHTGAQPSQRPHTGAQPSQRPHTGAQPSQRPHAGAQPPQRPHTGAQPPQRPHTGAQPPQRPHTGAQPPQRPHTGAQPSQRPHTGAQPPQRPHTGAQPPQRPHTGANPLKSSAERAAAKSEATPDEQSGFCRICGTKFNLSQHQCPRCGTPV